MHQYKIIMIQEHWFNNNKINGLSPTNENMFVEQKSRACIYVYKQMDTFKDTLVHNQFSKKDQVTIQAKLSNGSNESKLLIFVSAYFPGELMTQKTE